MRWKKTNKEETAPAAQASAPPAPTLNELVEAYTAQAEAAADLAEVDTTHLDRPQANPQALAVLNAERDRTARERIRLDFERERMEHTADHERLVDRIRAERRLVDATDARAERAVTEALADADEAAAELTEVREFERGASPATATRRLMEAVRGWRREEFAYAIAGSGLSAAGVASLVKASTTLPWAAAVAVAVALEVVLTVRVIRLIGQRAELAEQHKGQALVKTSAGAKALRFLTGQIVGLLAVSVLLNLAGLAFFDTSVLGAIGALGAGAAALASWSAWQASVAAAETVRSNVSAWQGSDWAASREELRTRAAGGHITAPQPAAAASARGGDPAQAEQAETDRIRQILAELADEQITALANRGTDALALMLNPTPPATGATDTDQQVPQAATPAATVQATPVADPAQEEKEEQEEALEGRTWPRPVDPEQGRRQLIDYAQWQIGRGKAPGIRDAARRMHTSARSITRYKESLAGDYPELMGAFRQQP